MTLPTLHRLIHLILPSTGRILIAVLLGLGTIGASVGLMGTSAFLISTAALHPTEDALAVAIIGVRFFGIARGVVRYAERLVTHDVTFRILARVRVWFYEHLEPLAPAALTRFRSGDLLTRITRDIDTLQYLYARAIAPAFVALGAMVAMTLFLLTFSPLLALSVLSCLVTAGIVIPLVVRRLNREPARRLLQVRAEMTAHAIDGVQGMAELILFNQTATYQQRLSELSTEQARLQQRMAVISGLHTALMTVLTQTAVMAALVCGIPLVLHGQLAGVMLAVLALTVQASFEAVNGLPAAFAQAEQSLAAARRLFEIIDTPSPVAMPVTPAPLPAEPCLVIDDLSFAYAAGEPDVLRHVSLMLAPGEQVWLEQPSGWGKTTLVNLLLRFHEFEHGRILLGGQDVRACDPAVIRQQFGLVTQQTHIFHGTVRQNLLVARPKASDAELYEALAGAHLADLVRRLPEGLDTPLGEQGMRLSDGERQRLAIARVLLKDAPILILDEATAHLDPLTAREVMAALMTAMRGRTVIGITHRRDTVMSDVARERGQLVG